MSRQLTSGVLGMKKFPTKGLVSYWKLDETEGDIIDSHGTNNGVNSGATRGETGLINNAYRFTDEPQRANIHGWFSFGDFPQGTVSLWCKCDTQFASDGYILGAWRGSGGNNRLYIRIRFERIFWGFGNHSAIDTGILVNLNEWYNVLIKWNLEDAYIYLNGQLIDTILGSITIGTGESFFTLGSHPTLERQFIGLIDEVGFWNKALTQGEITKLYNNGNGITL